MGNACRKNVKQQVEEPIPIPPPVEEPAAPAPPVGDEELARLKEEHDRLARDRDALLAELARWREQMQERMADVSRELQECEDKKAELVSPEKKAARKPDLTQDDKAELGALNTREDFLRQEMERLQAAQGRLQDEEMKAELAKGDVRSLLRAVGEPEVESEEGSVHTTESEEHTRALERIDAYYRAVRRPHNCKELYVQTREDCAEFTSQTTNNLIALLHAVQTGDDSWYRQQPIRGAICSLLQCGELPHDRWKCHLCQLMDTSDVPLLA